MLKSKSILSPWLCLAAGSLLALSSASLADTHKVVYKTTTVKPSYKPTAYKPVAVVPACIPNLTLKEGPYLGISGGYDSYKIHEQMQPTAGTISASNNPTINATGLIGGILAGYGHYFNSALYLGGEVFLNISQAYQTSNISISESTTGNNMSDNSKFFATTGYGASILPGVKLNDAGLVFGRLGYHVARLRGQENITTNDVPSISNSSSWSGGFGYGIGFEEAMVENFSLRGEYIHVDYRTFSSTNGTEYSPSNNEFMLSLVYHL